MILRAAQGLALALVAALLGLLIWRVTHDDSGASLRGAIAAGKRPAAPSFRLRPIWQRAETASPRLRTAVQRGSVTATDLRGRPTIVNVFASWCLPCRDEAPIFAAAASRYRDRVQFVALDFQDFDGDGRGFLRRYGLGFTALHDGDGSVSHRWGATGVPETYALDASGRIVDHVPGAVGADELQRLLDAVAPPA
jgi:cytochrome c biogenesis protein CcmG/thiol:disulfide interchange protein DsbE